MADYPSIHSGPTIDTRVSQVATNTADIAALKSRMNQAEADLETKASTATVSSLSSQVNGVVAKIPSAATSSNQLADKAFVNSALANKVDKVTGMGLSTNDYTTAEKNKVASIGNLNELETEDKSSIVAAINEAVLEGYATNSKVSQLEAKLPMLGGYLVPLLRKIVYKDDDAESLINGINALLNTIELTSITAVYTQPGTIYEGQPLDDLKSDLVVTANYSDGTSIEVNDYELAGTLTAGTSSIVVTYQEITTTFNVTVTDAVYYKDGSLFPGQVTVRNAISNSAGLSSSYVKDGVSYVFASGYANGGNATTQKRSCYYLFDLLVTPGKQYKYTIEFYGTPTASQTIQWSNGYYDETYRVAGVANAYQTQDYSSHVQATSWVAATQDGNTLHFVDTAPAGFVGVRITLKCVVSGSDAVWPDALPVKRLIIQEVE